MEHNIFTISLPKESMYNSMCKASLAGSYVAYLRGNRCASEKSFFYEVSASLQFPWYFGENWDALDECLVDLEWIGNDSIIIIIDDFSQLFGGDEEKHNLLRTILNKAIQYWNTNRKSMIVYLNN